MIQIVLFCCIQKPWTIPVINGQQMRKNLIKSTCYKYNILNNSSVIFIHFYLANKYNVLIQQYCIDIFYSFDNSVYLNNASSHIDHENSINVKQHNSNRLFHFIFIINASKLKLYNSLNKNNWVLFMNLLALWTSSV